MPEQYVVPQFIDVEDKIFGPISVRQFLILLFTAFIEFILYSLMTFVTFVVIGLPLLGIAGIIAFAKMNGQSFHLVMLNFFLTFKRPRLRVWYREISDKELLNFMAAKPPSPIEAQFRKTVPEGSRLAELSLIVNTGGVYRGEGNDAEPA